MRLRTVAFILLSLIICKASANAPVRSVYFFQADLRYKYEVELLNRVLELTQDEYGVVKAVAKRYPTKLRGVFALTRGQVDIAFLGTSQRYESDYLPVKVPILQGMLGYRLLLTTNKQVDKVAQLNSLRSLQTKAVAGFGLHWEDARILRHNEVLTIENSRYDAVMESLYRGDVDYIPRGLNEVFNELEKESEEHQSAGLQLATNVALFYPHLRYFFVARYNQELAERLEKGLNKALADGSFQAIFNKHFSHAKAYLKQMDHQVIRLENPYMPNKLPDVRTDWWLPSKHKNKVYF